MELCEPTNFLSSLSGCWARLQETNLDPLVSLQSDKEPGQVCTTRRLHLHLLDKEHRNVGSSTATGAAPRAFDPVLP